MVHLQPVDDDGWTWSLQTIQLCSLGSSCTVETAKGAEPVVQSSSEGPGVDSQRQGLDRVNAKSNIEVHIVH